MMKPASTLPCATPCGATSMTNRGMRLPRDPSGAELARATARLRYRVTRRESSHFRLTTTLDDEHLVTVPAHDPLKIGTIRGILLSLQQHHKIRRRARVRRLFGH
jgi:hypothetical protein